MISSVAKPARHLVMQIQIFNVNRPYRDSISKEMNDNDLNLQSMTKLLSWLCYWFSCTSILSRFRKLIFHSFLHSCFLTLKLLCCRTSIHIPLTTGRTSYVHEYFRLEPVRLDKLASLVKRSRHILYTPWHFLHGLKAFFPCFRLLIGRSLSLLPRSMFRF